VSGHNIRKGAIELSRVVKVYGEGAKPAVSDIDLLIQPGEFMTLLGPSGSGKTTTLNLIAGLERPTSGSITLGDRNIEQLPAHKRDLGMVFQNYALFPHMTVFDNIAFPLRRRKVAKSDIIKRVHDVLDVVGLRELSDRLPKQLSGGQQQRVALARAVVFNPPALLMDEPLGALDKALRGELQAEIARMHRDLGITFVFVTHDQEEALALSDRIAIFKDGKIEQIGSASELYESPESLFVAKFLGDANIFQGQVQTGPAGARLSSEHFSLHLEETNGFRAGKAALLVRPEHIYVVSSSLETGSLGNSLQATVTDVVYQGSHRKVRYTFHANGQKGMCMEYGDLATGVRLGETIAVTWDPRNAVLIPQLADEVLEEEFVEELETL
jgi:putative spermidine/putrescine transport system ATP-binding protein